MFKDKDAAKRMKAAVGKIVRAMEEATDLARYDTAFSKKDRVLIWKRIGHALDTDIFNILMELYVAHPALIPKGFLMPGEDPEKWAKGYKKVLRSEKKRRR